MIKIIKKYKQSQFRKKHYIDYLKMKGVSIGENVAISHENSVIDLQLPWLITIGENVYISSNVTILTHDYARTVIANTNGFLLGGGGPITIGNNVYIGMHCTILRNTTIGNDIIIGANSLVHGTLTKSGVYAGNPAKYLYSIDEYYKKESERQIEEAYLMAKTYFIKFNTWPKEQIYDLYDYQWLWMDVTVTKRFKTDFATKNTPIIKTKMSNIKRPFASYDYFIAYCKERISHKAS